MGSKSAASKMRAQICPSHAAPELAAELPIPAARALPALGPEPVSPVNPALAAIRIQLATVAAMYTWNLV